MTERMRVRGMRAFTLIWFGQLVSQFGSGLSRFALGVWVYEQTGSATQLALISLCGMLPVVLISPLAGPLVDRWNRKRTMVFSDLGSGLSMLAIGLLYLGGGLQLWHIYLCVSLSAAFSAFMSPALSASIPLLVGKEQLGRANGMMQFPQAAEFILSPAVAGGLLGLSGLLGVLVVDAVTFFIAMGTLLLVLIPQPTATETGADQPSLLSDAAYGWHYLRARPGLLALMFLWGSAGFWLGIVSVLVTPLVLAFSSAAVLGVVMSLGGSGMLVGSIVMSTWGGPKRRMVGVFGFMLMEGIGLAICGLQPSALLFTIGAFCFFFAFPMVNGCTMALLQTKAAPEVQGRVFAMGNMISWASLPLGYLAAGPLADRVFNPLLVEGGALAGSAGAVLGVGPGRGIGLLFVVAGLSFLVIIAAGLLYPRLRRVDLELPDMIPDTLPTADAQQPEPVYAA